MLFFSIIIRNIFRRKTRSILTIIGITIGIAAVVSLVSISQGFVATWVDMLETRGTHITCLKRHASDIFLSVLDENMMKEVEKLPHVEAVAGTLVDMTTVDDKPMTIIYGFEAGTFVMDHVEILRGRFEPDLNKNTIMLGTGLADYLKKDVGDYVDMEADVFDITGVYDAGNFVENSGAIMPLKALQNIMSRQGVVTAYNIRLQDPTKVDDVIAQIHSRYPNIIAMGVEETVRTNDGVKIARATAWGTSILALIVGAIGVMNTMFMSVFERTREIGILKALGWRKTRILRMIMAESLIISVIGWICGSLLGLLAVNVINALPNVKGMLYADFGLLLFIKAFAVAVSLGFLGAIYPAAWGASISPMEAIRHE